MLFLAQINYKGQVVTGDSHYQSWEGMMSMVRTWARTEAKRTVSSGDGTQTPGAAAQQAWTGAFDGASRPSTDGRTLRTV
jgi:hypothetical protein